jgi:alpha-glucosidase
MRAHARCLAWQTGSQWMAVGALAALGCSSSSTPETSPSRDGGRMDAATKEVGVDAGPRTITLRTQSKTSATVVLGLAPFSIRVTDSSGAVTFESVGTAPTVKGDMEHAYGALGATHHTTTFTPDIIEGWDHVIGQDGPWLHATQVVGATSTATSASLDLVDPTSRAGQFHVDVSVADAPTDALPGGLSGSEVRVDAAVVTVAGGDAGSAYNQMGITFSIASDEHFFGLGERMITVDQLGQHYESWTEEGGIIAAEGTPPGPKNPAPNGTDMTHDPVPFFLSSHGSGLWQESTYRTGFVLGADDPTLARVYDEEPALHLHLFVHGAPSESLAHFTALTGRAHAPAQWVFGPRRRVDHGDIVNGVPEPLALRQQHVPTTMIDDAAHFLPNNAAFGQEASYSSWASNLHSLGYKAIGYYNAYVSTSSPPSADLVAAGRAGGYFVKDTTGAEFDTVIISGGQQTVATIDMTNPAAVAWYGTLLNGGLELGYDGWMLDFGEYLPQSAVMFDGRTGWEMHNEFPVLYEQATVDFLRRARGDDFMFFARAGFTGSQAAIPVMWSGDPAASFAAGGGLPSHVMAGINAGLSGVPFWGSDISGYTCLNQPVVDKELYLRWAEFGALSSDMHDENACSGASAGAPPKWTLWSDAETTTTYASYALLHTRLLPYTYAAALEAETTGLPVMRHAVLMIPGEPNAYGVTSEYFFGPSLYVAPVVERGAVTRSFWLPPGGWFDWWTLAHHDGGAHGTTITVDAPQDTLPLAQRAGSIIAMLDPSIDTLVDDANPTVIGPNDVADVLDVRGALDASALAANATLADGTTLSATLAANAGTVTLPAGITVASTEADLSTCDDCGEIDALGGGVTRVRVTTAHTTTSSLTAGPLVLQANAGASTPVRYRWDVSVFE